MRTTFSQFTSFQESGLRPSVKVTGGGRVYRGVTLIRAGLGNRRDMNYYTEPALKEAADARMFEGLKAYADHPTSVDEQIQPERSIRDYIGLYENTRFKEGRGGKPGRVTGDLRIFKSHRWLSDMVDELIEIGHADKIGLSINGNGKTERQTIREAGEELEANVVSKFVGLRSSDVVTEAGAGGGFQQILESARGASKETPMNRKDIQKALREAVDAGDVDQIEALTTKLKECGCEDGKKGKKADAVEQEPVEESDPDADLEEAADRVKDDADPDADNADDDGAETDDLDESDDDDQDDEADGADPVEEADPTESDDDRRARQSRRAVERLRQHARPGAAEQRRSEVPTRENAIQGYGGKKKKDLNGVPSSGKGSFTKKTPSGQRGNQSGRRYAESDDPTRGLSGVNRLELRDENTRLKRALQKERQRNERLAESLGTHRRADLARKLLKESDIAGDLRPMLVERLVRSCPGGDLREAERYMRREIEFHQRLVESAASRASEDLDEFDAIEGAGSRFRESYSGGSDGEDEMVGLFRESGLPMKAAK